MNIASFCIRHKVTTILAFVIISIFGLTMYADLKLTMIPEVTYPGAVVFSSYSGAAPEDIEELVTRPIESAIATVSGVKTITSQSSENSCMVMINYTDGTDIDSAAIKLREKFDTLRLPDGATDPIIQNLNMNELMPVLSLTVMGEDLSALQYLCDTEIRPALERIEGVAKVDVQGGIEEQISVAVEGSRLSAYGLSVSYLSQYLAASNLLQPGGEVQNGTQSLTVSTDGKFKTVDDIANLLIPLPTGGSLRLGELGTVALTQKKQEAIAKTNGVPCVVLNVSKQSDANEVEAARAIKATLDDLQAQNPSVEYFIAYDSSAFITDAANVAVSNILIGVLLAAFVVFLFLRRPGATFAIAVSMPFCILTVFVAMQLFDITLNMISLGGIALGVGMIVDNSIVVLENIYRYAADGHSRFDACVKGTKEVSLPVMASTLTTIAVFVPIGLAGGLAGMMFKDFCLTIAFLLLSSLLIAMTLVPLLCYFLLDEARIAKHKEKHDEKAPPFAALITKLRSHYLRILSYFIHRRRVAVLISAGLVVVFIGSCFTTDAVLLPEVDQGQLTVNVSAPLGTETEQSLAFADRISTILHESCPELDSMYYYASSTSASMVINLLPSTQRDRSAKEIANSLRSLTQDIAGCEIEVGTNSMTSMASGGSDIYVQVTGPDHEMLGRISNELKLMIAALPGAVNVSSSVEDASPAVKVRLDHDKSAAYGLNAATIGAAVRSELSGASATSMTVNGKDIDVVIKGNDTASTSLDALRSLPISTQNGEQIPLSAVAQVDISLSPQTITRENQSRQVSITGSIDGVSLAEMTAQINGILEGYSLPQGYSASTGGTFEDMQNSFSDLLLALLIALGLVYFVLASQFESFIMPLIVMMILPLALSGALFGLPITGSDLSMMVIVGLIMLSGVIVNASIILVDYIKVRRLMGESKEEAILSACPLRIRPILMTTLTTVLAMVPMALGIGEGAELMQPMSIVMISGMLIATLVTLFFTPVYYSLLDSINTRLSSFFFRKKKKQAEENAPAELPPIS